MNRWIQFIMPTLLVKTSGSRISFNIEHLNPLKRRWAVAAGKWQTRKITNMHLQDGQDN